jgi:molybdate transport system permease protein
MGMTAEEWGIVLLSLQVSLAAIAGALPLVFLLAWVLARLRFPGKILLDGLVSTCRWCCHPW